MSYIYHSDLAPTYRAEFERDIRTNRPDLVAALDDGLAIVIGESFDAAQYHTA